MMKSFFSGSAALAIALLLSFLLFSAKPSLAESLLSQFQKKEAPKQTSQQEALGGTTTEPARLDGKLSGVVIEPNLVRERRVAAEAKVVSESKVAIPASPENSVTERPASGGIQYVATAYSLRGKTASGRYVSRGIIAADPRVLPLGSRVRLEAGPWSGEYLVADTGGAIRGRKIDIWTPSSREAMRFGRRKVKLTVLSYPAKRSTAKRRA